MFFQWELHCKGLVLGIAILHVPCACTLCVLCSNVHVLSTSLLRNPTGNGLEVAMPIESVTGSCVLALGSTLSVESVTVVPGHYALQEGTTRCVMLCVLTVVLTVPSAIVTVTAFKVGMLVGMFLAMFLVLLRCSIWLDRSMLLRLFSIDFAL